MKKHSSSLWQQRAGAAALMAVLVLTSTPLLLADRRSDSKEQVQFGIELAQKNLWKEAEFRWEKAVELDPTYPSAWNNLAIAYEQAGKFDEALKAYERARKLDPKNIYVQQNYDLFMEIYERQNRRRDR
ncbi:MAG: tetratricopeptide repeat protein [Acidimicrobiia bacterium]|nr:tetratricopeptide repeat protein [Acidimicrobiia bacterium]